MTILIRRDTPGGDHAAVDHLGARIADEDGREHIDRGVAQGAQRRQGEGLARAADVAHQTADGLRLLGLEQDVAGALEVVGALLTGRVIQGNREIALCRAAQTLFDDLPRGQQVGQADAGEVAGQGRAEHRAARAGRRDAGDDLDFDFGMSLADLKDQTGHAVNARVARGNDRDGLSLKRPVTRRRAAVDLPGHAGHDAFLALDERGDEVEI